MHSAGGTSFVFSVVAYRARNWHRPTTAQSSWLQRRYMDYEGVVRVSYCEYETVLFCKSWNNG